MTTEDPKVTAHLERHNLLGAVWQICGPSAPAADVRRRIGEEIMARIGSPLGILGASDLTALWDGEDLSRQGCAEALVCMHDGPWRDRLLERVRSEFAGDQWRRVTAEAMTRLRLTAGPDTDPDWESILSLESLSIQTLDDALPTLERDGDPYHGQGVTRIEVLTQVESLDPWRALAARVSCALERIPIGEDVILGDYVGGPGHTRTLTRGPSSAPQPRLEWIWSE